MQLKMSSTLFGRGVNAQVGMRRRAEQMNRELAEVKAATSDIKDLPRDVYMIKAQVASFEKTVLAHLEKLERRVDAIGNFDARLRAVEEAIARLAASKTNEEEAVEEAEEAEPAPASAPAPAPAPRPAVVPVQPLPLPPTVRIIGATTS